MREQLLRIRYNNATHRWYCVAVDRDGTEQHHRSPGRSPEGTEADAERYLANFRKYGAWLPS